MGNGVGGATKANLANDDDRVNYVVDTMATG